MNNGSLSSTVKNDFVRHVSASLSLGFVPLRFYGLYCCVVYHFVSHYPLHFSAVNLNGVFLGWRMPFDKHNHE